MKKYLKALDRIWILLLASALMMAGGTCPGRAGELLKAVNAPPQARGKAVRLNGAGATFPYPVYSQWMHEYNQMFGVKVIYQSIGSGGGIAQIRAKTVDFGASDAPLKKEELDSAGLVQFPMIMGGVVVVANLEGVSSGRLHLSRKVLAEIFLGNIRRWDNPIIKVDNPGLKLPSRNITVVHRADGSGTTWIFTNYLDKISQEWHERVGTGKAVDWPTGIGGKGNEGVSAYVQRVKGGIGYVEYAYAVQNRLSHALLENKAGKYASPTIESFQAAAANANWGNAPGFYMVLTDQSGAESWPITGASFILVHKDQRNCAKAEGMLEFFNWCYEHGGDTAKKLHYVPIPESVVSLVESMWREAVHCKGAKVWN